MAQQPADAYLAGYAAALLEHQFHLPGASVRVRDGVMTVVVPRAGNVDQDRLLAALRRIDGVQRVELANEAGDALGAGSSAQVQLAPVAVRPDGTIEASVKPQGSWLLAKTPLLFESLDADPRWPHFAAAWQSYRGANASPRSVAAVSFGESFSLYRDALSHDAQWEIGVQAGLFAIFDMESASYDLVNADYFVGPVAAWRSGDLSMLARVYHQSSHLGDEFLLHNTVPRINLSYEVVDLLLSWDVTDQWRLYGGGGYLFDSEPHLEPWLAQAGVEWEGPLLGSGIRPVAMVDVQQRQEDGWATDVSARAGLQFEDPAGGSNQVQVLLEYYNGHSPNGQFFDDRLEWFGIGIHFHF